MRESGREINQLAVSGKLPLELDLGFGSTAGHVTNREVMGYASRDYGFIGMATEELNSGCSRKNTATARQSEAFHWRARVRGVKHGRRVVAAHGFVKLGLGNLRQPRQ